MEGWRERGRRRTARCGAMTMREEARKPGKDSRGNAKPRCGRFEFGKSAFVGNRARSAREGRDQWP